jgi:hypothetical protein
MRIFVLGLCKAVERLAKRKGNLQEEEEEPEETRIPMNGLSKCSFGCPTTKMPFLIIILELTETWGTGSQFCQKWG